VNATNLAIYERPQFGVGGMIEGNITRSRVIKPAFPIAMPTR
jgi:hypothetical protein